MGRVEWVCRCVGAWSRAWSVKRLRLRLAGVAGGETKGATRFRVAPKPNHKQPHYLILLI